MNLYINPNRAMWQSLCNRPLLENGYLESTVRNILDRVKKSGDSALRELIQLYDKASIGELEVTTQEVNEAIQSTPEDLKAAIQVAASNIKKFHTPNDTSIEKIVTMSGVTCWSKSVAIDSVGIYVPGGSAPLFSTVLMLGIPAKLAGCREIILCTPSDASGKISPAILFAASLIGVNRIFKVGGAQAIAAMAYGTESIPRVNKIVGPGNQFVTSAKQLVSMEGTAIDFPAGPSEVLIITDESATPAFVASDLIAQAEHGEDSQTMLVAKNKSIIEEVFRELEKQLQTLPRKKIAARSMENSKAIVLEQTTDIVDFVNLYAPEHLIINTTDATSIADNIRNAGSVFIGNYSAEAIGDYASGPNHTLPTNGNARAFSGISVDSFKRNITFQEVTQEGIRNIGPVVECMAAAENLEGHKLSVRIRRETLK